MPTIRDALNALVRDIAACTTCDAHLPLGPRPVVRLKSQTRILIIGQAPGTRVHESGIPWDDKSGDRLRAWLGVDSATFYNSPYIGIMPMGFCYPGANPKGGDNPPRPECAPLWHDAALCLMPEVSLTLLVGQYAQARYLGATRYKTMTETVRHWRDYMTADITSQVLPTPHPSWRTTGWLKKNPWFEVEILPILRARVAELTQ